MKQGLGVIAAVLDVLDKSGYNNHTTQEVVIQSTNKVVLTAFKKQPKYKLMYKLDEDIRSATNSSLADIKSFADSVAVSKKSVFPDHKLFLTGSTDVLQKLHAFNLSIYVYVFTNEFVSQRWDFFSDPMVEINSYVIGSGIQGVITDFPGTVVQYKNCFSHLDKNSSDQVKLDVVSHNGASGMFPDSTDLAYNQAIQDGADYIDCTVQMTQDGIPVCLSSIDLLKVTTVA